MRTHVIGAGGVGSWLVPQLVMLGHEVILWDGDTLETKNLNRQLFKAEHVGMNKAAALALLYAVKPRGEWFHADTNHGIRAQDFVFSCADNHRARREILAVADTVGFPAIITGNGYIGADAYIYRRKWKGTALDPRVRYPEILTSSDGDPITAEGCTGEAQEATPQLVLANVRAADHGLHLFWFHSRDSVLDPKHHPIENGSSEYEQWTKTAEQLGKEYGRNTATT